jgi:hypothetical protein
MTGAALACGHEAYLQSGWRQGAAAARRLARGPPVVRLCREVAPPLPALQRPGAAMMPASTPAPDAPWQRRPCLTIIEGSGSAPPGPAARRPWPTRRVARIPLGAGGWVLTLRRDDEVARGPWQLPPGLVHWLQSQDGRGPSASAAVARVPAALLPGWLGPAILRCGPDAPALLCADDQISGRAATALAALVHGAAAPQTGTTTESCFPDAVIRVGHHEMPAGLHPAVMIARPEGVTGYVCEGEISRQMASATGELGMAYTQYVAWGALAGGRAVVPDPA